MQYCNATISIYSRVQCLSIIWMYLLWYGVYIFIVWNLLNTFTLSQPELYRTKEKHTHCCHFEIDSRICLIIKPIVNQMQSSSIANQQLELWEAVRLSPSCGVRDQHGLHANFSRCFGSFDVLVIMQLHFLNLPNKIKAVSWTRLEV